MENRKILEKAAKELEKRVSAVSNLNRTIEGTRSDFLDVLILDENKDTRKAYGNVIKLELEKKIAIAKNRVPQRTRYIENMEKVISDLDKRIAGKKTDDSRKNLLNLNKKNGFDRELLKDIADEIIQNTTTNSHIDQDILYKKIIQKKENINDIIWLLEHRTDHITDEYHKKNIQDLLQKLRNKKETVQEKKETKRKR